MNHKLIHSLTGLFLLAALVLLVFSVVSLPDLQNLLGGIHVIHTWMPEAYVSKGSPVNFRQYRVGSVIEVKPHLWSREHPDDWFEAVIGVDSRWEDDITEDFSVTADTGALGALTGTKLILRAPRVDAGGAPEMGPVPPGGGRTLAEIPRSEEITLPFKQPPDLVKEATSKAQTLLDETVPKVNRIVAAAADIVARLEDPDGDLFRTLGNVRSVTDQLAAMTAPEDGEVRRILARVDSLVARLNDPAGPVLGLLANVNDLVVALRSGEGVAGALLTDPAMKQRVTDLLERTQGTLENVRDATAGLPQMVARLQEILGRLDQASRSLPGAAEDVRRTIQEANGVLSGIKNLPILRSYIAPAADAEPIVLPSMTSPPPGKP